MINIRFFFSLSLVDDYHNWLNHSGFFLSHYFLYVYDSIRGYSYSSNEQTKQQWNNDDYQSISDRLNRFQVYSHSSSSAFKCTIEKHQSCWERILLNVFDIDFLSLVPFGCVYAHTWKKVMFSFRWCLFFSFFLYIFSNS